MHLIEKQNFPECDGEVVAENPRDPHSTRVRAVKVGASERWWILPGARLDTLTCSDVVGRNAFPSISLQETAPISRVLVEGRLGGACSGERAGERASLRLPGSLVFLRGTNLQGELLLRAEGGSGLVGGNHVGKHICSAPGNPTPAGGCSRNHRTWGNAKPGLGLTPSASKVTVGLSELNGLF